MNSKINLLQRPDLFITGVMLLFLSVSGARFASAQDLDSRYCFRVNLSQEFGWATSGVSMPGSAEPALLVVDTLQDKIMKVSSAGVVSQGLPEKITSAFGAASASLRLPTHIHHSSEEDGFLILDDSHPARILHLNTDLGLVDEILVENRSLGNGVSLMAVFDFVVLGDGILAFADLLGPESGAWESAFIYLGPSHSDISVNHQIFYRLETTSHPRNYYIRNIPYLASIGSAGYILLMREGRSSIGVVQPGTDGVRELEYFPEDFRSCPILKRDPRLPPTHGPRHATMSYETIEKSNMAIGLFSWKGYLYLLAKEARSSNGETAWWLITLNPKNGQEIHRLSLPALASHLTIVPGEKFWMIIEKDSVQGLGDRHSPFMRTSSMALIPAGWLDTANPALITGQHECIYLNPQWQLPDG